MFLYGFDDKDVTKGDVIAQQNNEKYVVGEWERLKKGYELRSAASLFRCENDIQVTIAATGWVLVAVEARVRSVTKIERII